MHPVPIVPARSPWGTSTHSPQVAWTHSRWFTLMGRTPVSGAGVPLGGRADSSFAGQRRSPPSLPPAAYQQAR